MSADCPTGNIPTLQAILETMVAGTVCGIVYALFAGQPLNIMSETPHVLVFETMLNYFCM